MATLTDSELKEAVQEWCEKRGIPVKVEKISFRGKCKVGRYVTDSPTSENFYFNAEVSGIEMPPYHGPYR